MKRRILRVCYVYMIVLLCAVGYYFLSRFLGIVIPCPLHMLTGLNCPGCGNTRAFDALIHLHFYDALRYNYFVLPELAFVLYAAICTTLSYVKTGVYRLTIGSERVGVIFVILLLLWGVIRNFLGI